MLVFDWRLDAAVPDTGFSEAAADALFAHLVGLDDRSGGKLLASPLHFIGQGRGASVNSEVIQRLGTYRPAVSDVQMTTLDPHDFAQATLDIPVADAISFVKTWSWLAGLIPGLQGLYEVGEFLDKAEKVVKTLGLGSISRGDLSDPNVQVWSNVRFADNYWQSLGQGLMPNGYGEVPDSTPSGEDDPTFTFTSNGRSLRGADVDLLLQTRAGFTVDEVLRTRVPLPNIQLPVIGSILPVGANTGLGLPGIRLGTWYAGTVDLTLKERETVLGTDQVVRRLSDLAFDREDADQLVYGTVPIDPLVRLVDYADGSPWYRAWYKNLGQTPNVWAADNSASWEGVGTGWAWSHLGGSTAGITLPSSEIGRVAIDESNLVSSSGAAASTIEFGGWDGVVPTIYNGNFQASALPWYGRVPFLAPVAGQTFTWLEVPGWSLQGGGGNGGERQLTQGTGLSPRFKTDAWDTFWDGAKAGIPNVDKPAADLLKFWVTELFTKLREALNAGVRDLQLGTLGNFDPDTTGAFFGGQFLNGIKEFFNNGNPAQLKTGFKYLVDYLRTDTVGFFGDAAKSLGKLSRDIAVEKFVTDAVPAIIKWVSQTFVDWSFEVSEGSPLTHDFMYFPTAATAISFDYKVDQSQWAGTDASLATLKLRFQLVGSDQWIDMPESVPIRVEGSPFFNKVWTLPPGIAGHAGRFQFYLVNGGTNLNTRSEVLLDNIKLVLANSTGGEDTPPVITSFELTPNPVDEKQTVHLNATFTDEGQLPGQNYQVWINWGDDTPDTVQLLPAGSSTIQATHVYADDNPTGTSSDQKLVRLKVFDGSLQSADQTKSLLVNNVKPSISGYFDSFFVNEGSTANLHVAVNDVSSEDSLWVRVEWPDGSSFFRNIGTSRDPFDVPFQFVDDVGPAGTPFDDVEIKLSVYDDDMAPLDAVVEIVNLRVRNLPPVVTPGPSPTLLPGEFFTPTATFTDPGVADTHTFLWQIFDETGATVASSTTLVAPTVQLNASGTYTAVLTVTDDDGGVGTATVPALVTAVPQGAGFFSFSSLDDHVDEGSPITLSGEVLGAFGVGIFSVHIDWGDGSPITVLAIDQTTPTTLIPFSATHTYADDNPPGSPVAVTADLFFKLPDGTLVLADNTAKTLFIDNVAPVLATTLPIPTQPTGTTNTFVFSAIVATPDPGADPQTFTFDFGDGTTSSGSSSVAMHTYAGPGTYLVRITLDDGDGGISSVRSRLVIPQPGSPPAVVAWSSPFQRAAVGTPPAAPVGQVLASDADLTAIAKQAVAEWLSAGYDFAVADPLAAVRFEVTDLPGDILSLSYLNTGERLIRIDRDAGGWGWYIDSSPASALEFDTAISTRERRATIGPAAGAFDLLTALTHEFGLLLGLPYGPGVMQERLDPGTRRFASDVPRLVQGTVGSLANGDFEVPAVSLNGAWRLEGGAAIQSGQGVLTESPRSANRLSQAFTIPAGAQSLSFDIVSTSFDIASGEPGDAFEVSLLDADTAASLAGVVSLTQTDALLNVQADGAVRLAPGVTMSSMTGSRLAAGAKTRVSIDLRQVPAETRAVLGFNLLGFGALGSRVVVDNVAFNLGENTAPLAVGDVAATDEDTSVLFDPRVNDSDAQGQALQILIVSGPAHGTLSSNADGTLTYMPVANYSGNDEFAYQVSDGSLLSNVVSVSLTIKPVNDAPTLAPVASMSANEGDVISVNLVAADIEGDAITYVLDAAPAGGTIDAQGRITWTAVDGPASAVFTVRAVDSQGASSSARSFTVNVVNVAPTFTVEVPTTIRAGEVFNISLSATDPGADTISQWRIDWGDGTQSTLVGTATRASHTYAAALPGAAITVQGTDEDGTWTAPVITRDVLPINTTVNHAPIARADSALTLRDQPVTIDVLANDAEPDGQPMTAEAYTQPAHGTLARDNAGRFVYSPAAGYVGGDSFSYRATDGQLFSDPVTVTIQVRAVNDAPVAVPDSDSTPRDTAKVLNVLSNDSDPNGDVLSVVVVTGPSHGALAFNPDGTLTYTPALDYSGADSFTYRASDGLSQSGIVTVNLDVTPVNHPPVLAPVADANVNEGSTFTVKLAATDADADGLTYVLDAAPAGAAVDAAGNVTWTATDGPASVLFTAHAVDAQGASSATRSFTVNVTNVAPNLAVAVPAAIRAGEAFTIGLQSSDPGADTISQWRIDWGDGTQSTVAGTATSVGHTYVAALPGTSITVQAIDEDGTWTAPAITRDVLPAITPVNRPPVLAAVPDANVLEGSSYSVNLSATDPDGDAVTYVLDSAPAGASIDAAGVVRWNATNGPAVGHFTARAVDAAGASSAPVSFAVNVLNVAPVISVVAPTLVRAGTPVTVELSATDPGTDTITRWRIDWGDGSVSTVAGAGAGAALRVSHTYTAARAGTAISVQATDADGTWTAPTVTRDVLPAIPAPSPRPGTDDDDGRERQKERERESREREREHEHERDERERNERESRRPRVEQRDSERSRFSTNVEMVDQTAHRAFRTLAVVVADNQPAGGSVDSGAPLTAEAMQALIESQPTAAGLPSATPAGTLQISTMVATEQGLRMRFNQALSAAALRAAPGSALLLMRGDQVVPGTLVIDPDGAGLRFDAAGGTLAAGEYRVLLRADSGAFVTPEGHRLDGDYDGRAGGDYQGRFTIPVPARVGAAEAAYDLRQAAEALGDAAAYAALSGGWGSVMSAALGPLVAGRRRRGRATLEQAVRVDGLDRLHTDDLDFAVQAVVPAAVATQAGRTRAGANDWEIRL